MTRTRHKLFAVAMMMAMVLTTFAPAVGAATASVTVQDGNTDGDAGNEEMDDAGNEEMDDDDGEAGNEEMDDDDGDEAGNAPADDDAFGQSVSTFVGELVQQRQAGNTEGPIGLQIASFVTANNPGQGNGPPAFVFGVGNEDADRGPPAFAGAGNEQGPDGERGPPEDRGPDGDQGPPDDAGPDNDGADAEEEETDDEETETATSDDGDSDDSDSSPGNSGGNGNGSDR